MGHNTLELDKSEYDRRNVEQLVEREFGNNTNFNMDVVGEPGQGTVRYEASMNTVVVDETPSHIRVKIDTNDEAQMAIEEAIKTQENNMRGDMGTINNEKGDNVPEFSSIASQDDRYATSGAPTSAMIELMEDGTININWGDSEMVINTMAGIFIPKATDNRDDPLIYVDEDTNLTESDADEIAEAVRRQLRQYV